MFGQLDPIPEEGEGIQVAVQQKKALRRSLSNIIQKVVNVKRRDTPQEPSLSLPYFHNYTSIDPDLYNFFQRIVIHRYRSLLKHENPHLTIDDLDKYSMCSLTPLDSHDDFTEILVDFYDCSWILRYRQESVATAIARQKWHDNHPDFKHHSLDYTPTSSSTSGLRPTTAITMFHDAPEFDEDDDWKSAKTSIPERDLSYIEYSSSLLSSSNSLILTDQREPTSTPVSPVPIDPPPVGAFYDVVLLNKLIIQSGLKELTDLQCIPSIHDWGLWLDSSPEIRDRMPRFPKQKGLSWILEDPGYGVPITTTRTSKGTDKLYMLIDGSHVPLTGRKMDTFLDALTRIQLAFSTIRSSDLGPVSLYTFRGDNGIVPAFELDDRFDSMTADITPTYSSVEHYFRCILENSSVPPFLRYLGYLSLTFLSPGSAPYPLIPPSPLWAYVLVDPATGEITHLRDVQESRTGPWEVAVQPPFSLPAKSRARYVQQFKRRGYGSVRGPKAEEKRTEDIVECLLMMPMVRGRDEERKLEERMVLVLFGTRDVERRKIKWEKERTMI